MGELQRFEQFTDAERKALLRALHTEIQIHSVEALIAPQLLGWSRRPDAVGGVLLRAELLEEVGRSLGMDVPLPDELREKLLADMESSD